MKLIAFTVQTLLKWDVYLSIYNVYRVYVNIVWFINDPGTWNDVSAATRPGARFSMVYGVVENFLYVTTGEGPGKVFYNDVWRYDIT